MDIIARELWELLEEVVDREVNETGDERGDSDTGALDRGLAVVDRGIADDACTPGLCCWWSHGMVSSDSIPEQSAQ